MIAIDTGNINADHLVILAKIISINKRKKYSTHFKNVGNLLVQLL